MAKFDYEYFEEDNYGMVFNRKKYTDQQAITITAQVGRTNIFTGAIYGK